MPYDAAMERPIILGVDGESRKIVEESGSGVFIEPENAEQLAQTVLRMSWEVAWAEAMGRTGGEFVRQHYNRDYLAEKYLDVLKASAANLYKRSRQS